MGNERQLRVAHIVGKLVSGGIESVVYNYYKKIDKDKVQFDFYYDADSTARPPQELIDMGARFIEIPPYQKLPAYLKALRTHFKENNYTVVHSHINTLSVFPLFAAWCEKIPVRIAHNHSVPAGNEFKRNILKYFLRCFAKMFSTHYFACSEKAGRWMFGNKSFDDNTVFVLKNAVDFASFQLTESDVKEYKEKLGIENKFVVGHVGRFTYAKNHKLLIDLFSEIVKIRSDAVLMLVGDGEMHDEIINMISEKKLSDKVILVGQVSDPEKYYQLADVMVIPSIFEGLSLATIESQVAGVPVVVSEAIPSEAVISNACVYQKLTDSPNQWADTVIKTAGIKTILNDNSKEYDIDNKVCALAEWYLKCQ